LGWFPALFYTSTWIAECYMAEHAKSLFESDRATRAGSFALLLYSIVALSAGIILPNLQWLGKSQWFHRHQINECTSLSQTFLRLCTTRNFWTTSQLIFAGLMFSTLGVEKTSMATAIVACVGICWAVTCWVPFSLVMEFIREIEEGQQQDIKPVPTPPNTSPLLSRRGRRRVASSIGECTPLLNDSSPSLERKEVKGGTILGIHNLALVAPQFVVALVASLIFKLVDSKGRNPKIPSPSPSPNNFVEGRDVVYVFAFGGAMSIIAALFSRAVPPTENERIYVDNLSNDLVRTDSFSP